MSSGPVSVTLPLRHTNGKEPEKNLMKTGQIIAFLREFAPPVLAEDWDNTGLLIGRESSDISRILTCLTLTPDVATEAIESRVQLIVTHHPVLFRAVRQIVDSDSEGRMLLDLIESGIGVYSPHTSYDSARSGINQQLAAALGLQSIQPLRIPAEPVADATSDTEHAAIAGLGSGRFGDLAEDTSVADLLELTKAALQISNTQFVGDLTQRVNRVGIACGAAADFLRDAAEAGCQVLLTGEARFHACLEARTRDIALILPGHYATERPAIEQLAKILGERFPELQVFASQAETDPVRWT